MHRAHVSIAAGATREEAMAAFLYSHARGSDGGIQNALAFDEACIGAVKALCQDLRNMKEHGRAVAK
jgi:hypothetical protein